MYDTKIALVLKNDLADWQKLNVAAFLASAVAIQFPETHGQALVSASGTRYLPFLRQPMLVYKADDEAALHRAHRRATERGLGVGIYTEPLFATKGEAENLAVIASYPDEKQPLVGLALYGDAKQVSKALDGLKFHA
ncbi:DUF2000 domain-containing protein [Hymenobacter ginsengisoli]|uniref:DUF2000 domain-containing protein n=1 Tax=Hymenobacter ginsengisoli TaxID=1051626 RepID=A0ABP8QQ82_9BACT|nr:MULTISPECIES: DUF2000 family protein [unclassified Hymenobacter]MBO2031033.1 DUF2000 family protein [Hymenobacter sp. BT559]